MFKTQYASICTQKHLPFPLVKIKIDKIFLKANLTIETELQINYRWPYTYMKRGKLGKQNQEAGS
jgi:hypothetical protein